MAQQDPCWINLHSLLESSLLYFLLRTSSANTVSVSAAELKMYSWCRSPTVFNLFFLSVRKALIEIFEWILSSCSSNALLTLLKLHPLLCSTAQNMNCPISMTAFTLHCKTTAHNSTTTVLQKFSVLQRYYTVHSISTQYGTIISSVNIHCVSGEKSSSWYEQ